MRGADATVSRNGRTSRRGGTPCVCRAGGGVRPGAVQQAFRTVLERSYAGTDDSKPFLPRFRQWKVDWILTNMKLTSNRPVKAAVRDGVEGLRMLAWNWS